MIDLKAQLYWARVERWVALGTFALGFNSSKSSPRQLGGKTAQTLLFVRAIPDAKLKKPPPKNGWRLF
jgi:hypothetical protein